MGGYVDRICKIRSVICVSCHGLGADQFSGRSAHFEVGLSSKNNNAGNEIAYKYNAYGAANDISSIVMENSPLFREKMEVQMH